MKEQGSVIGGSPTLSTFPLCIFDTQFGTTWVDLTLCQARKYVHSLYFLRTSELNTCSTAHSNVAYYGDAQVPLGR